jgi:hypothetical protein
MRRAAAFRTFGLRTTALLGASLLLLSGCGDRPGYDRAAVERYLHASQGARFGGAEVGAAHCPSRHALSEGMTVHCTLTVSGAGVPFVVTLRHVHAADVLVSAKPDGVLIPGSRLSQVVGTALPANARSAKVDCGGQRAFVVAKVGETITCSAVLGSQSQSFKLTVKDTSGRVAISS